MGVSKNNISPQKTPKQHRSAKYIAADKPSTKWQLFVIDHLIWFLVASVFLAFSTFVEGYFTVRNLSFILYVAAPLGMLVFAQAIVLLTGKLDLSVAQISGLSAILGGTIIVNWLPAELNWLSVPIILLIASALGSLNGFLIGTHKINAFLVTLSTYLMFDWLTYFVRKGAITKVPSELTFLGGDKYTAVLVLLLVGLTLHILLQHTRLGSTLRAIGSNEKAAEMLGISLSKALFLTFTLSGLLAGLAAILYIGYLNSIPSTVAEGDTLFLAFAGAIIGGVNLNGGRGSIVGALGGILLIGVIQAGTTMIDMDPSLRGFINGLILLIAVVLNKVKLSLRDKILKPESLQ